MKIIINPNLIFWPSETLKLAIPSVNFDYFVFFDFKESYLNIFNEFSEAKSILNIRDESKLLIVKSLVNSKVLINNEDYPAQLIKSEIWTGLRYIDSYKNREEKYSISKRKIEEETINIIDDFFSETEKRSMAFWFATSSYRLNDIDNEKSKYSRHWVNSILDVENNCQYFPIFKKIDSITRKMYSEFSLELFEIKAYLSRYGDLATYHQDSESIETLTVVIYFHKNWDIDWNGELLICDKTWEPHLSILPKPGRIVIFNGKLPHRAGIPTKICFEARKSLVFRYKIIE